MTTIQTLSTRTARPSTAAALQSASGACIAPRTFDAFAQIRGEDPRFFDLEAIRDRVVKQTRLQDPRDIVRTPSQMHLEWDAGLDRATLRILGGAPRWLADDRGLTAFAGLDGFDPNERLVFTHNGLRAYVREIMGGHAWGILDRLVAADTTAGAKVATMNAALLSRPLSNRPLTLRTVRTRDPVSGGVVRAVRGVFRGYTAYDDAEFVGDLLDNAAMRALRVLDYRRGDDGMRIRFALSEGEINLREQTPIVDAWNGETGRSATWLMGGSYRLICTNGMIAFDRGAKFGWRHTGSGQRVRDGVPQALSEIRAATDGLVDRYNEAVNTQIDDAFAWMQAAFDRLDAKISQATVEEMGRALDHETATPGRMLGSVVDAVTWIAQHEADLYRSRELETLGARVLSFGLNEARRSPDGRLHAPLPTA